MDYKKIGIRIRKYRKAINLSQEQLAELVGISPTHMSHIETGSTKLSLPVLVKISKTLSVKIDDIIYEQPHQTDDSLEQEIYDLFSLCTPQQQKVLFDIIKSIKSSILKYIP